MKKFTITGSSEDGSALFIHAFGKDAAHVKAVALALRAVSDVLVLNGHCEPADNREPLHLDDLVREAVTNTTGRPPAVLSAYAKWFENPEQAKATKPVKAVKPTPSKKPRSNRAAVLRHFNKKLGTKGEDRLEAMEVDPNMYAKDRPLPDYVLRLSISCYTYLGNAAPWLLENHDPQAMPLRKFFFSAGDVIEHAARVTEDVPGAGLVTVDIFHEAIPHQGFF